MKKAIFILISILLLVSCSSISDKSHEKDIVNKEVKSAEDVQFELLNLYTLKKDLKCSALFNVKQITDQGNEAFLLTEDGKLFEIKLDGGLYSNDENCIEIDTGFKQPIEMIYDTHSLGSSPQFYVNGKFYEYAYKARERIYIFEESRESKELVKLYKQYDEYMFIGRNYIKDNIAYRYDNESKTYSQAAFYGLENDEYIYRFLRHNDITVVLTNKAIYTLNPEINKEECRKYIDVDCKAGYQRNDILTDLYANLTDIKLYYDGEVFIDKDGNYYKMKINYQKISK